MAQKIKPDVLKALDDWKAGKPVKSIELGHVHRMATNSEGTPRVDLSVRFQNDQERAHAYCFAILGKMSESAPLGIFKLPFEHDHFLLWCEEWRSEFTDLTPEERNAAEGLAWKALHVGWARAIAGHDPSMYIEVSNPAVVAAT